MLILLAGCVKPIDPEDIGFEDLLVVESLLTDQFKVHEVMLTRTISLDAENDTIRPETNAMVWVTDETDADYVFEESAPGIYSSVSAFAGVIGRSYQLIIEISDGSRYESDEVVLLGTPSIDSLYADFVLLPVPGNPNSGQFEFYLDARSNPEGAQFFRWIWNSTFELTVSNPSKWLWLGGTDVLIREIGSENDDLQVERCWVSENSTSIRIGELLVPEAGLSRLAITSFNADSRKMYLGYSLEVKQYALSEQSYNYWNELAQSIQEQGSLSDSQVGTVKGNISAVTNPEEVVLGLFEASQEVSVRRQWHPLDFNADGYRRQTIFYVDCSDLEPIVSTVQELEEVMNQIGESHTITFFITEPPTVVYHPKRCSDCTLYGSNQRPDFWE